jgi:hypothetical protein
VGLLGFLDHWWNLPFLVMLGLVAVFFVLQLIGLLGHGDADADVDHEVDADADADMDHDGDSLGWSEVLSFFGVGRVPLMVVWVTLFLFTGMSGIFLNSVFYVRRQGYVGWFFAVVLAVALTIGLTAVRLFSRLAARLVDTGGKGATQKHELAGKLGVVASAQVDARHGEVRVRDEQGNELLVHGCTQGAEAPIKHGAKVVLVDYDKERELFWVTLGPDSDEHV